jgi:chemotaxis methyl-accepting protein methylase
LAVDNRHVPGTNLLSDRMLSSGLQKSKPRPLFVRMSEVRAKVRQRIVDGPFLRVNECVWNRLPSSIMMTRPILSYGAFLHSYVQRRSERTQYHGTFFLRNRPELELIRALANQKAKGSTLRLAVLGCSNGAEVYSILWTIRTARPDLKVTVHAADISKEILEIAEAGVYSLEASGLTGAAIFERLTAEEMQQMFDAEDRQVRVKSWIREGITFQVADAGDPALAERMGYQDIVVANNFLCHMAPPDAERCLRNFSHLVKPGGYLFVSGVDLGIRTRVALDLGWTPLLDSVEEIHDGDPSVRNDWPWKWWALEPFTRKRRDWNVRYASLFQLGAQTVAETMPLPSVK